MVGAKKLCVCVGMGQREIERERVCVRVCVWERERENKCMNSVVTFFRAALKNVILYPIADEQDHW